MVTATEGPHPVDRGALERAVRALAGGLVVAMPTDTVYGLAVDPRNPEAVARLFALKERPREVALPVLVASREQVGVVAAPLDGAAGRLADRFWPGPLTLVVPRAVGFTADLGGTPSVSETVGVRWPDHPVVHQLCTALGPLAVTSANIHGSLPASTADEVARMFPGAGGVAVVLDGGPCDGLPSTVVECRDGETSPLRHGAIAWNEIEDPVATTIRVPGHRR
jgi:L-threonylcarbamoyladenylate synthase